MRAIHTSSAAGSTRRRDHEYPVDPIAKPPLCRTTMTHLIDSPLVPCNECGAPVSPASTACVKCKAPFPVARCRICWEPAKYHEIVIGVLERPGASPGVHRNCVLTKLPNPKDIFHASCHCCSALEVFVPQESDSIVVRTKGPGPWLAFWQPCKHCGEPAPFCQWWWHGRDYFPQRSCYICGLLVFPKFEPFVETTDGTCHESCGRASAQRYKKVIEMAKKK
jgi:hypothetical protein